MVLQHIVMLLIFMLACTAVVAIVVAESIAGLGLGDNMLRKFGAIPDETTNTKELVTLKNLEAQQLDLSEDMDSLVLKAFALYQ